MDIQFNFTNDIYQDFLHKLNHDNINLYPFNMLPLNQSHNILQYINENIVVPWGYDIRSAYDTGTLAFPGAIFFNQKLSITKDWRLLVSVRPEVEIPNLQFSMRETPGVDGAMVNLSKNHGTTTMTLEFSMELINERYNEDVVSQILYNYFVTKEFKPLQFWYGNKIYMVKCNGNIKFIHQKNMGNFIVGSVDFVVMPYKYILLSRGDLIQYPVFKNFIEETNNLYFPEPIIRNKNNVSNPVIYFKIAGNIRYNGVQVTGGSNKAPKLHITINGKEYTIKDIEVDKWYVIDSRYYQIYSLQDDKLYGRNNKLVGHEFPQLNNDVNTIKLDITVNDETRLTSQNVSLGDTVVCINPYWRIL